MNKSDLIDLLATPSTAYGSQSQDRRARCTAREVCPALQAGQGAEGAGQRRDGCIGSKSFDGVSDAARRNAGDLMPDDGSYVKVSAK